jgi:hypothetical protein
MIVVLALLIGYYSYYNSVKDLRYKSIGQNLAQLQLEDVRTLSVTVIDGLVKGGKFPTELTYTAPNYPLDKTPLDDTVYDSGKIDGDFRIEHIVDVCGHHIDGTLPDLSLPASIIVQKVLQTPSPPDSPYYDYTIIFNKEVYPHYQKEIVITDRTPTITDLNNKIYEIQVTVYWTNKNGVTKSITITGEKSHARES